jgi:hypothetical protein
MHSASAGDCTRLTGALDLRTAGSMSDSDLFFVARSGNVWACWFSGRPAVNLGPQAEVLAAMRNAIEDADRAAPVTPPAPRAPAPPRPAPAAIPEQRPTRPDPQVVPDPQARKERTNTRHELTILGRVFTSGGSRDVTILDLSEAGCQFRDDAAQLPLGAHLSLKIGPVGPVQATVRWRRDESVGVQFTNPLYPSVLEHIREHFDLRRRA